MNIGQNNPPAPAAAGHRGNGAILFFRTAGKGTEQRRAGQALQKEPALPQAAASTRRTQRPARWEPPPARAAAASPRQGTRKRRTATPTQKPAPCLERAGRLPVKSRRGRHKRTAATRSRVFHRIPSPFTANFRLFDRFDAIRPDDGALRLQGARHPTVRGPLAVPSRQESGGWRGKAPARRAGQPRSLYLYSISHVLKRQYLFKILPKIMRSIQDSQVSAPLPARDWVISSLLPFVPGCAPPSFPRRAAHSRGQPSARSNRRGPGRGRPA